MDQDLPPIFVLDSTSERSSLVNLVDEETYQEHIPLRKEFWTQEQDDYLLQLKIRKEAYSFVDIAKLLNTKFGTRKNGPKVQDRWERFVDPNVSQEKFTKEDKRRLKELYKLFDGSASKIRDSMPGRSRQLILRQIKKMNLAGKPDEDLV